MRNFAGPGGPGDVVRGLQGGGGEAAARLRGSGPAAATGARKSWRKPLQHIAQNGVRNSWTASRVRVRGKHYQGVEKRTSLAIFVVVQLIHILMQADISCTTAARLLLFPLLADGPAKEQYSSPFA